jgi:hypothetical protein
MATASDLVGAWRLVEWALVDGDGRLLEHPLGVDAAGYIIYTPDGHVSATLMRTDGAEAAGDAGPYGACFAYAGRFAVRDGTVFHTVEVSTVPSLVGFTSSRRIVLDGDRLTLSGPDFSAGSERTQRITWQRAAAKAGCP